MWVGGALFYLNREEGGTQEGHLGLSQCLNPVTRSMGGNYGVPIPLHGPSLIRDPVGGVAEGLDEHTSALFLMIEHFPYSSLAGCLLS